MNKTELLNKFQQINVWKRGSQRAPHKPLLLLYALGKYSRQEGRKLSYREVDEALRPLLEEFGPPRKSYHPEYPFWRLQNDGIWEIDDADRLERRESNTDVKKSELIKYDVHGGLLKPLYEAVIQDKSLLIEVADLLLEENFPYTLHEDICNAVGLNREMFSTSRHLRRDPTFRIRVLTAYAYRCTVCGFDLRLGQRSIGLEAGHIKWHQAGGPDEIDNGLALCVMHHKLFDFGAFGISDQRQILVSNLVHGYQGVDDVLIRYHERTLAAPQNPINLPKQAYLQWHRREVFKGVAR